MKKMITLISCFVVLMGFTSVGTAQVGKSTMATAQKHAGPNAVQVKITDEKGQAVKAESLPPDAQLKLERVRKAADSLMMSPTGTGVQETVVITVSCTVRPFNCTITVSW
jgi:hypothetical protein